MLETRVRVSNKFWVIFHFLRQKSDKLYPQIIVSKLISKNFTCFPVKIVRIIAIFERE